MTTPKAQPPSAVIMTVACLLICSRFLFNYSFSSYRTNIFVKYSLPIRKYISTIRIMNEYYLGNTCVIYSVTLIVDLILRTKQGAQDISREQHCH